MARQARLRVMPSSGSCYTPDDLKKILAVLTKVKLKPVDHKSFFDRLNRVALLACAHEDVAAAASTACQRVIDCRETAVQAKRLRASLEQVQGWIEMAGHYRAVKGDPKVVPIELKPPPDAPPPPGDPPPGVKKVMVTTDRHGVVVDPTPLWPVGEYLWQLCAFLPWLARCAEDAAALAEQERGGTSAGLGADFAVERFTALFHEILAEPARPRPYKDRDTGEVRGILIDFLEACLLPLGYRGDRASILRRVEKAKKNA